MRSNLGFTKVPIFLSTISFPKWNSDQLNISSIFFKIIFSCKQNIGEDRFTSDENIGERESNFDEKNVEELNWSEVHSEKKYH